MTRRSATRRPAPGGVVPASRTKGAPERALGEAPRHTAWLEAQRDEPGLRALTDPMAREVRNAVLFHGGGHEREAPGGEPP